MRKGLVFVVLLLMSQFVVTRAESSVHLVRIQGMAFDPPRVHARPGDTVVWENLDLVPHNVFSDSSRLNSGVIKPGERWSLKIRGAQKVDYVCTFHPGMSAVLEVREGGQER